MKNLSQLLVKTESEKLLIFGVVGFLLDFGYSAGFFSANALVVTQTGMEGLLSTYLAGALSSMGAGFLLYFLIDRLSHPTVSSIVLVFSGGAIVLARILLNAYPQVEWLYIAVRATIDAIFVLTEIVYWVLASDAFSNYEAKRRFPLLAAIGIIGEAAGGLFVGLLATRFHAANMMLWWAVILILSPMILSRVGTAREENTPGDSPADAPTPKNTRWLALLLFIFWVAYSFISLGTDYFYNLWAFQEIRDEDKLTAYFGSVGAVANGIAFIYHFFVATPFIVYFGYKGAFLGVTLLMAISWGLFAAHPSLLTISIAEGAIFFFIEQSAVARLNSLLNVFPSSVSGRMKTITEGIGRPAGVILLFILARGLLPQASPVLIQVILATALLMLAYPFIFNNVLLGHLISCLKLKQLSLLTNVIQAMGERGKKSAIAPLLSLLRRTNSAALKQNIILSLGQIQSREALGDIVALFKSNEKDLQLTIIKALSGYDNYEAMLTLLKLIKYNPEIAMETRRNAALLLTRLVGKRMVPYLLEALLDNDPRIRANAVEAMGLLKDKESIPVLSPFLNDLNHRIRANAIISLHPFRSMRKQAEAALEELLISKDEPALLAGLYAIGRLKLVKHIPTLVPMLGGPNREIAQLAATALALMGRREFAGPFIRWLADPDEDFAVNAARRIKDFPRASRLLLFDLISKLPEPEEAVIEARLKKTLIDFSVDTSAP